MFKFIYKALFNKYSNKTHLMHYHKICQTLPKEACGLELTNSYTEGPFCEITYSWKDSLSYDEADRLDSRLRAFISCIIYEAISALNIRCIRGPDHGIRPSWIIDGCSAPISLVRASFDYDNNNCYLTIGPIITSYKESNLFDLEMASAIGRGMTIMFGEINV